MAGFAQEMHMALSLHEPFFFAGAGRQRCLDELLHQLRYGQRVLLLTGEVGTGKSCLLSRLLAMPELQDSIRMLSVPVSVMSREQDVADAIRQGLGLPVGPGPLLAQVQQRVQELDEQGISCVAVVDDAGDLPDETLRFLLALAQGSVQGSGPGLHVVLAGTPELVFRLNAPAYQSLLGRGLHLLPLEPLNDDEGELLISDWEAVYNVEVGARLRQRLLQECVGLPGELIRLLEQAAAPQAPLQARRETAVAPRRVASVQASATGRRFGVWVLALLSCLLLATLIYLWAYAAHAPSVAVDLPAPTLSAVTETPSVPSMPSNPEAATTVVTPAPVIVLPVSPEPEALPEPPAVATLPVPNAPVSSGSGSSAPAVEPDWFASRPAEAYTLQLFSSTSEGSWQQFLSRHQGLAVKGYVARRQGRIWYVAVLGVFPDREVAAAHAARLPPDLALLHPWPRTFASIQAERSVGMASQAAP